MLSFKNGRLTINSAIYLSNILISFIMGITPPITVKYFTAHEAITPAIISTTVVLTTIAGSFMAWLCTSTKMLDWLARRFMYISLASDLMFLFTALFGASHPVGRFLTYKIICLFGLELLKRVQKRNVNLSMADDGDRLSVFNNTCEWYSKCAGVFGGSVGLAIYFMDYQLNVTLAMMLETIVCSTAHALQIYTNYRIQKDVLKKNIDQDFIDALNNCFTLKKKNHFKSEDPFDR